MLRRAGWIAVIGGVLAQATAMGLAIAGLETAATTSWLAIIGITATLAGTLALGAMRRDRLSRPAMVAVVTVVVVLLAGFGAALLLPVETVAGPLWLGLPRRAAIILLGVGLVPVLVLPACYALDAGSVGEQGRKP